jgi:anti-anti-sigma factor
VAPLDPQRSKARKATRPEMPTSGRHSGGPRADDRADHPTLVPPTLPGTTAKPVTSAPTMPAQDERPVATYDRLGQTVVATITAGTLTGEEAADITGEVQRRLSGQKPDGTTGPTGRHVVLDMQSVQYMDSGCIGVLVELLTSLQNAGGRIALVNAGHNVESLFKLTKLDRLFPICRDVMKAIEAVERAG